jgi:hypothetical protein
VSLAITSGFQKAAGIGLTYWLKRNQCHAKDSGGFISTRIEMITDFLKTTTDGVGDEWVTDGNFSVHAFWRDAVIEMAESILAKRGCTEVQALFLSLKWMREILLERGQEVVDANVAELEAKLHEQFPRENAHQLAQKMARRFAKEQDDDERAVHGEFPPGELSPSAFRKGSRIEKMTRSLNREQK